MKQWEYQVVDSDSLYPDNYGRNDWYVNHRSLELFLNDQGEQGWDLVSATIGNNTSGRLSEGDGDIDTKFSMTLIFKRPRSY